ncbi:hypothetical protein [Haematomicrobium sanguinis]|uniref:hypothetical protein n=1 Tax=Haematomicrobium sanguinis TaxID=479106 RepID=UPI00047BD621|nr:hypothetical protein [Haematomicrobium sanguinis]
MEKKLTHLLDLHAGAVRQVEIQRAGISKQYIRQLVRAGQLFEGPRGVLTAPGIAEHWAELRSKGLEVTCATRATTLKLWTLYEQPRQLHVSFRRSRGDVPDRLRLPNGASMPIRPHYRRHQDPHLNTVLHALRCRTELDALLIAESSVIQRRVSLGDLHRLVRDKRVPHGERAVVTRVNPASGSYLETLSRFHLENAGFQVQIQKYIEGLGHLDAMINGVLGLELDGRATHDTPDGYNEDRRRNNVAVIRGVPTLRVTWEMVRHDTDGFIALVRKALNAVETRNFRER